jgi:heme A synthase
VKLGPSLILITSIAVFLQLLLGGLLTFNFISSDIHIVGGLAVFALAIATTVAALVSKPRYKPILSIYASMVGLVILQGILGFATLDSGSQVIAWLHFVVAMAIYGASVRGVTLMRSWDNLANAATVSNSGVQQR